MEQSHRFEAPLVVGDHGRCLAILDEIERQLGFSLWTIENLIAILQLAEGLERQKSYITSIKEARANNDPVSFIAFHVSHRNEPTMTPLRFVEQMTTSLRGSGLPEGFVDYLLLRIANQVPHEPGAVAAVLRYEAGSAIVNYYDTFVRLAQRVVAEGWQLAGFGRGQLLVAGLTHGPR